MSRPGTTAQHITPYDRFAWSDVEIERMLVSGEHRQELGAYFGETEYRDLVRLARKAERVGVKPAQPHVFVIPGILGSQLGIARRPPLPNDVLWLDPIDIQVGRLRLLGLDAGAPIVPLGVVLYSHLKLRLRLRAAGFGVTLHDYDWRLGIEDSGAAFAERLRARAGRLAIVAHSMGGLVSRVALALPGTQRVEKVVLLGTPNRGSFAPVQALRGTYAVVRKIARLDGATTAERLAEEVFNSFPSLYQMVPASSRKGASDLLDPRAWPQAGPALRPTLLERARRFRDGLAPADERFVAIAGVGQETITAASKRRDGFVYTVTRRGDGTVPADSAALDGASTYFANAAHSDLTRDAHVASAIVELLRNGATKRLPTRWTSNSRAEARVSDRELRRTHSEKVDWASFTPVQRREFLQDLNEPLKLRLRIPGSGRRAAPRAARAARSRA